MDLITKNPGLQHVAENIYHFNLLKCQNVNTEWKKILESPYFWLKKCVCQFGLSSEKIQENQSQWLKLLQNLSAAESDPKLEKIVICHLMELCERNKAENFENPIEFAAIQNLAEIVKIVAPLVKHPNAPGYSQILMDGLQFKWRQEKGMKNN